MFVKRKVIKLSWTFKTVFLDIISTLFVCVCVCVDPYAAGKVALALSLNDT